MKGPATMPVIIVTGQGAACVDLVSELNRFGPNEYISKPWPEKGRTLATVIKEVLNAHAQGTQPPKAVPGANPASKSQVFPRRRQMSLCHIASTGFSIIFALAENSSAPTSKSSSRSQ